MPRSPSRRWRRSVNSKASGSISSRPSRSPPDLLDIVATATEREGIQDDPLRGRLLFSIKEAVYKAVYPLDRMFLDHHDVEVSLAAGTAVVRNGRVVRFRYCVASAHCRAGLHPGAQSRGLSNRTLPAGGASVKSHAPSGDSIFYLCVSACGRNRGRTTPVRVILLRKAQIIFYIQKGSRNGHNRSGFGRGPGWDTLAGSVGEQVIRCRSTLLTRRFTGTPGRSLGREMAGRSAHPSAGHASRGPVREPEQGCCAGFWLL